ncbi:Zinc finger protein dzip1 [Geranomyces variabilis]|uniref:Zinc finger protein dzip1 n=1 Tax=Geranomyces variabilis TaxID=109894 RepID=A0AAD5TIG5_9FUNG|nr:Zinc finger protein dzip1 [Geranomyces variabilis]
MTTAHRSYFAQHVGARTHHRHGEIYNDIEPCSAPPAPATTTNKAPTAQPAPSSGPKYIKRRKPIPPPDPSYSYLPPPPQMSPTRANDGSAFLHTKGWWACTANETPVMAGFYFRRRRERVNWRLLSSMNIDQIMKEVDIKALQDIMENLTFCDIDGEDLRYPDQNIVKLIKLAQLTIEYLLHSQQYLLNHRRALTTQAENLGRNLAQLRAEHVKQGAEVASLKKETRVLRKSMYAYQLMTKLPGGIGQPAPAPAHGAAYYRCPQCEKVFVSQAYVECHVQRRHPESTKPPAPPPKPAAAAAPEPKGMTKEEVMEEMERVNGKIADVESHLRAEMERKVEMEIACRQAVLDEALQREKLKHEEELREMRASMRREQEAERLAIQKERDELAALKEQLQRDREANSKFGVLEDDVDSSSFGADMFDNDKNEKTQQEIEELKNAFATSKRETQAEVESRLAIANAQLQAVQRELRDEQARKAAQEEAHRRAREQDQATNAAEIDRVKGSLEKLKGQLSATVSVDGHGPPGPPVRFQAIDSGSESDRPPQPAASDKLDWEGALKLLAAHSQLPLPTSAWVKTLFPHDPATFLAQRAAISGEVDARLARLGVPAARIEREWGTGSGIEADCERAFAQLDSERTAKARSDPLYERMRAFLGEAVESAAGKSRKGSKPPPIVTAREDKPPLSAAVGPVSASVVAGRRPPSQVRGRHGPRPRTTRPAHMPEGFSAANRFMRRPSGMPPLSATTPTLGGWKFPSLRRAPRSGANGAQPPSADINWDDDSSEFTGSEDETIPSARSDRKRGNTYHQEPPTPRSAAASYRRRSLSEGGFRAGGGGVARRGSTASRRPNTTTATAAARLQSVPPSPSVFKEGFSRLSRALSLTTAGAKDIFRKSAPASFPRQPVARPDSFRDRHHDSAQGSPTKRRVAKESSPRRRSRAAEAADSYDGESDETFSSSGESSYSLRQPKSATVQRSAARPPASPKKQSVAAKVLRTNNTGRHPPQQRAPPAPRSGSSKPDPLAAVTDKLSKFSRNQKSTKHEKYVVSDIEDDDPDFDDAGRSSIADSDDSRQWNPRSFAASYENNRSMSAVAEESEESASQAHAVIDRARMAPKPVTSLRHQPPAATTAKAVPAPVLVVRPLQSAAGRSATGKQPAILANLRVPAPASKKTESEFDISPFMSDSSAGPPPAQRQPTGKAAAPAAAPAAPRKTVEDDINLDDFENFSDIMTDDDSKVGRNSSVGAKSGYKSGKLAGGLSPTESDMLLGLDSLSEPSEAAKSVPKAGGPLRGFPSQTPANQSMAFSDEESDIN